MGREIVICFVIIMLFLQSVFSFISSNKISKYVAEEMELHIPKLEDISVVLQEGLYHSFKTVEVKVVPCPDLTKQPFSLAAKGLNGSPTLMEVGGEYNLFPLPNWDKIYDFKDIKSQTRIGPAFVIGAGPGPYPYVGTASEMITNCVVDNNRFNTQSQVATINNETGQYVVSSIPNNISTYAFMANFFICEGLPGKVLQIKCSNRVGEHNFPNSIRKALVEGFPNKSIGVGGTFLISNSKVRQHLQPRFSKVPLVTKKMQEDWLNYFNMSPPLVALGTLLTSDPGLDLRTSHFHSTSNHGEAGHYHYDIEPHIVEYLGYFNVANKIVRIDRPQT